MSAAAIALTVVVLSKHQPDQLALEGCGPVTSLRATPAGVEVCSASRCNIRSQAELTCPGGAIVRLPSLAEEPRRYGRRLTASIEGDHLRLVTAVDLEPYVAGVVASEMAAAPEEARKALAIVARSYALSARHRPRHEDAALCDLTHCQVFRSVAQDRAVEQTRGRTLAGPVFFHSTCGGRTQDAHLVWPELGKSDLIGISDSDPSGRSYCAASPHFRWIHEVGEGELARALDTIAGRPLDAASLELENDEIRDQRGSIPISSHRLHLELGRRLGWNAVKSPFFEAERAGRSFRLRGNGLGHGVGLCQFGAMERARRGASADDILRAYFPKLFGAPISAPSVEIDGSEEIEDEWRSACEAIALKLTGGPAGTWRVRVRRTQSVEEFVARTGRPRFEAAAFAGDTIWVQAKPILDRFGDLEPIRRHECVHARLRFLGLPPLPRVIEEGIAVGLAGQSARLPPARTFDPRELTAAEQSLARPIDREKLEATLARAHATIWPRWHPLSPEARIELLRRIAAAGAAWVDLL